MKEFITAARRVENEGEDVGYPFQIDGVDCIAYPPEPGQLAVLLAATSRHSSEQDKIAGMINFFVQVLDQPTHTWIVGRLLDRKDPFGLDQVEDIMEWLIEQWSGRPTPSPSVSTASPKNGGQRSTPPTSELTSSVSHQTDF
jgi:hypothetical protein